ncbi:signal recognition particle receptor subunit beta-like isoform X2 [Macadamia integrifolia]|uniref:signal recognition particle receptor subunit beta-like isoform X2 n=1 Tax=Macadamia integrifolia TaxID=60698 RepID=UPI001C4EDD53|nr:signal recognition particle receptor subunit beta-like isoform X2 [Macadamia integrifolia]
MKEMEQWTNQLQQWIHQAQHWIHQIPSVQIYVAIGVLFLTTAFFFLTCLFRRTKYNTIVLAGLSGSGKTVLFHRLQDGSLPQGTVTSMDPNEGDFVLHSESSKVKMKHVHLVDVPGHPRLRPKLYEYLPQTAGLIFVVEALEFLPNCRAAAEYLYDILTNASVVKRKIPVLILCNKTDKVTAHTKEFIKKQLEKEIDKLRASRNAISAADISNEFTLGNIGEAFSFSQCHNKVTIAEASGLTGDVVQAEQFIREHIRP